MDNILFSELIISCVIIPEKFINILYIEYYMNRILTNLEVVLLGLISERPMYGYEIEKVIKEKGIRNWVNIGFSSIYAALKKLEGKNLIRSKIEFSDVKPAKKIYSITKEGKITLKREIKEILSTHRKAISDFDLGIANLPVLSKEEIIDCLKKYLSMIDERIKFLKTAIEKHEGSPYFVIALFERPLAHAKTEKKWVLEFIKKIEKMNK